MTKQPITALAIGLFFSILTTLNSCKKGNTWWRYSKTICRQKLCGSLV
ncbi:MULTISPECIES: hypothetical protein [unclassified Lacinutrix]